MKAWLAILSIALALPSDFMAQGIRNFYNWEVSTSFSYEQHDKRLYEFTTWIKEKILEEYRDNHWGTSWYSISIHKNLLENDYYQLKAGLGYATEIQRFKRPFGLEALFPSREAYPLPLLLTNHYKIKHLQIPIDYSVKLGLGFRFNANVSANFSFFKRPGFKGRTNGKDFRNFVFDFYSVSCYPGLQYRKERFTVTADYRLFQIKKIDKVIFNGILFKLTRPPDPRLDDVYETYNPAHLRLSVSYAFGKKELAVREVLVD